MAAWPKISRGGIFEKFSARGGIPKIPPYPPIPVAWYKGIFLWRNKKPCFVFNLTELTLIQLNLGLIQLNLAKSSC